MIKKVLLLFSLFFCFNQLAHATACGTTTVSSTGIVDTDGFTWSNGTYTANLVLPPQVYNPNQVSCTTAGNTFNFSYTGAVSATGTFSVALPSNTNLSPAGTQWAITVCPNARAGCITFTAVITGTTQNITTALNAVTSGPRFQYTNNSFGYSPTELITKLNSGMVFFNTTLGITQTYNGSSWINGSATALYNTMQDDFCGTIPATTGQIGQLGWDSTVIVTGTNPVAAAASVANHPCLITLTTNTTATNGVDITLGHGVGVLFPGNSTNWQSEQIAEINQITSGSYRVGFGTVDTATAIPTNGIYFRFLQGTDTAINACFDVASTETCTATTVTLTAADYVDFFMSSTVTGAVTFTVVDVTTPATSTVTLCPSGCTAAATAPTGVLSPLFSIAETGSSVADVLTVDYFLYQQGITR